MAATIPHSHRELLDGPVVVSLVTLMPDGRPQATPVWAKLDGNDVLINTAVGRQKDKNLRANPCVTVLAIDPENPYNWIEVRGTVTERIDGDETVIDELAQLYTGSDRYFGGAAPESSRHTRVTYRIRPERVNVA
jgi:PPOX class probable F420-dependent enzyme